MLQAAAVLALMLAPSLATAGASDAGAKCPTGSAGHDFDGLLLCVPDGNGRYRLTEDGVDSMAWREDDPVAMPGKDAPATGNELHMTLARAWIGETAVGMADKAAGKHGFDRFMSVLAASILDGAQRAASPDEFAAEVPMDESGLAQHFGFTQVQPDLLEGRPEKPDMGLDFILFRPSSGTDHPHLMLCSGGKSLQMPTHMCLGMRDVAGHRIGIMVTGTNLERSFRIPEQIASDLESFVIRTAP